MPHRKSELLLSKKKEECLRHVDGRRNFRVGMTRPLYRVATDVCAVLPAAVVVSASTEWVGGCKKESR